MMSQLPREKDNKNGSKVLLHEESYGGNGVLKTGEAWST